jgi:hypothetical protein
LRSRKIENRLCKEGGRFNGMDCSTEVKTRSGRIRFSR